jgi:hypothetical protein
VSSLLVWPSFPIRVFFIQDSNFTTTRRDIALDGFDQWVDASGGQVDYQVVSSLSSADVTVSFDPSTANGLTELHFSGLSLHSADMTIGTKNLPAADIHCVAAHEFGHALGINGHSDSDSDLMFPIHVVGEPCPVTSRDINTLKTGYCDLFGRATFRARSTHGPTQTIRIQ